MKFDFTKVTKVAKVVGFKVKEVRPEIMLGVGAISVLAGTIMACVKTKKAEPVVAHLEERKEELDYICKNPQADEKPGFQEYARVYVKHGLELVKIYALPAALWTGGMACIFGSHGEMRTRNAKLLANSAALARMFSEYRDMVREKLGEEAESELYFNAKEEDIEIETTVKKTKTRGRVFRDQPGSMWARNITPRTSDEFDVRSYFDNFIDARVAGLNSRLRLEPFVTINDVYDEFGLKPGEGRCPEGMTVGWVWHPKIDRGDREIKVERLEGWEEVYDPVSGGTKLEPCLRLDFNCYPLEGLI